MKWVGCQGRTTGVGKPMTWCFCRTMWLFTWPVNQGANACGMWTSVAITLFKCTLHTWVLIFAEFWKKITIRISKHCIFFLQTAIISESLHCSPSMLDTLSNESMTMIFFHGLCPWLTTSYLSLMTSSKWAGTAIVHFYGDSSAIAKSRCRIPDWGISGIWGTTASALQTQ